MWNILHTKTLQKLETIIVRNVVTWKTLQNWKQPSFKMLFHVKTLQNWKQPSFKMLVHVKNITKLETIIVQNVVVLDLCPNAHTSHSVCMHVYITSAIDHQWESYTFLQGLYYYFFLNQMLYIFTRFFYITAASHLMWMLYIFIRLYYYTSTDINGNVIHFKRFFSVCNAFNKKNTS